MSDEEAVERVRKLLRDNPAAFIRTGGEFGTAGMSDVEALLRRHDHYRDEFVHHTGGDGRDCDCVESHDRWARGEIK